MYTNIGCRTKDDNTHLGGSLGVPPRGLKPCLDGPEASGVVLRTLDVAGESSRCRRRERARAKRPLQARSRLLRRLLAAVLHSVVPVVHPTCIQHFVNFRVAFSGCHRERIAQRTDSVSGDEVASVLLLEYHGTVIT